MELRELLEIGPGLTALIGGGGKTTLMYHLASELRQQGTVLVCTTTKIWPPAHLRVCTEEGTLREELRRRGIACAGMPAEQGKLTAPAIDGWETMADFVLVEADGSAGRPFKAHADWEPVLPEERQATVLVMGADGFGKPISRMAHRPELYARLAGAARRSRDRAAAGVHPKGHGAGPAAGGGAGLSRDGGDPAGGPVAAAEVTAEKILRIGLASAGHLWYSMPSKNICP